MKRSVQFNRLKRRRGCGADDVQPNATGLNALLTEHVAQRFERLTGLPVATVCVNLADLTVDAYPSASPAHPACTDHTDTADCRSAWNAHLDELRRSPEPHWHRCYCGMLCAVLPLVWCEQCVAVSQLLCPGSMDQQEFERNVELLDIIVGGFVSEFADFLAELTGTAGQAETRAPAPASQARLAARHPKVRGALTHIEENLVDSSMTVTSIARALGANTTYLSHLFAEHMGVRMSRYIAARRIDLAKKLLATRDWQIKRIAHKSGHGNAEWFSEVFREHTGQTPTQYRRTHKSP